MNKYLITLALKSKVHGPMSQAEKWVLKNAAGNAFSESIIKVANTDSKLRPKQREALEKLDRSGGLILHHGLGSGKTLTFLTAAAREQSKNKNNQVLIVAPASLTTNVDKEIAKHKLPIDRNRLHVYSYEKATNISDDLKKKKFALAIADEAHKLRNEKTKRTQELSEVLSSADKRLLATATGNYNHAGDISSLVNIAAGYKALPSDKKEFSNRYIRKVFKDRTIIERILGKQPQVEEKLVNKGELGNLFEDHVHHYDPKDDPNEKLMFPKKKETFIEVEMSPKQVQYYKFMEGQIPFWLRMKIRHNLPLDKKEKSQLNSFSQGVRQVSNSYRHLLQDADKAEIVPKIHKAVENIEKGFSDDKNFKALVYSNYLDAGVHEYAKALDKKGIKYGIYTGSLTKEEKDKLKNDFNAGKIRTLLVSSSGGEGLDLKGIKKIQILDQHFNKAKIDQVIGRGIRYGSHQHLPEDERNVDVEHYLSVHPKNLLGHAPVTIDSYLSKMSDDKQEIFEQIKDLMKEKS